jgi:hypothetical protein
MAHWILRSIVAASSTLIAGSLGGCGGEPVVATEDVGAVSSAVGTPDPADVLAQKKVHAAFDYAYGKSAALLNVSKGASTLKYPCTGALSSNLSEPRYLALVDRLDDLKQNIGDGNYLKLSEQRTTIRYLPAVEVGIVIRHCVTPDINTTFCDNWAARNVVNDLVDAMTTCWGSTVAPFAKVGEERTTSPRGWMVIVDPRPAKLTANLAGSTGATAAAVFVADSSPTMAYFFGSTWASGSAPAGTPCSTIPLATEQETTKEIQAAGSLRRCY